MRGVLRACGGAAGLVVYVADGLRHGAAVLCMVSTEVAREPMTPAIEVPKSWVWPPDAQHHGSASPPPATAAGRRAAPARWPGTTSCWCRRPVGAIGRAKRREDPPD